MSSTSPMSSLYSAAMRQSMAAYNENAAGTPGPKFYDNIDSLSPPWAAHAAHSPQANVTLDSSIGSMDQENRAPRHSFGSPAARRTPTVLTNGRSPLSDVTNQHVFNTPDRTERIQVRRVERGQRRTAGQENPRTPSGRSSMPSQNRISGVRPIRL